MCQYGDVAEKAAKWLSGKTASEATTAWKEKAKERITAVSSREKSCPKHAFIGLCEYGFVKDVVRTKTGNPNRKNAEYAVNAALFLLDNRTSIAKSDLWGEAKKDIADRAENENGQMGVVLALWNHDPRLIVQP